jgi:anti-sigma regulatory factor (Ser/Thr protein kinase)
MAQTAPGEPAETKPVGVVEIDIPSRFDLVTVVRMIVASSSFAADALVGDRLDDLRWVASEATTNAIQANQLLPHPGRVRIRCAVGRDWVRLAIADEGPGMPPEVLLPDITDPDRLDIEGGFGIPLMRTLTAGDVVFHSTPHGTTVELELHQNPLQKHDPAAPTS